MTTIERPRAVSLEGWTYGDVDRLLALTREQVIELWHQCPAVEMAELCGEYEGLIPNAGDPERQARTAEVMYNENARLGYWLGKAYFPLSHTKGDGYNRYRKPGNKVHRLLRFATEAGTSLIDGKPSLMMYYGAYHGPTMPAGQRSTLIDEIRKLTDGIYLGMGTTEKEDGTRTDPGHFALRGPVGKWVGVDDPTAELI